MQMLRHAAVTASSSPERPTIQTLISKEHKLGHVDLDHSEPQLMAGMCQLRLISIEAVLGVALVIR